MRECQALFGFSGAAWSQAVRRGDIEPRPRAVPPDNLFCIGDKRKSLPPEAAPPS
jgi:hypothetical protein